MPLPGHPRIIAVEAHCFEKGAAGTVKHRLAIPAFDGEAKLKISQMVQ